MDLDDLTLYHRLDPQDMLGEIAALPEQLRRAWELGHKLPLPKWPSLRQIAIAGMGGSAIGADLARAYAAPLSPALISVIRDYDLPAWASGPETLVVASSHSGNTAEILSAFEQALERRCSTLVLSTGGQLAQQAAAAGSPVWLFEHRGQPRAAVGYSFGLILALLARLNLIPDPAAELAETLALLGERGVNYDPKTPATANPAKRQAGQLIGRWVSVFGAELLEPVARRWKGQINEHAKAWGQFEALPEADHNTLAGTIHPQDGLSKSIAMFLLAASYHPQNRKRVELTQRAFMLEGIATDTFVSTGESRLAQQWTALQFGDYMAYYLAIAYGVDPTPVDALESFKRELG